jgi:hypothetical protein
MSGAIPVIPFDACVALTGTLPSPTSLEYIVGVSWHSLKYVCAFVSVMQLITTITCHIITITR